MIVSKYSSVIALLVIIAGSLFLAGTATAALEFELRSVKESYLVAEPILHP
jgi:hypothetical protein